jgi:hypothetical protein
MRLARDFDFQLKVDRTSDQELKWQRRRNRRGMLAPKTSPVKTNNVETYYHLPIPENVVKASLADPLVTPLLLRKKVKLDPWDRNREFKINEPTLKAIKWKKSAEEMSKAIDNAKHSEWRQKKIEASRKQKSMFAQLNDSDHMLLGRSAESMRAKTLQRQKGWKAGPRERLGKEKIKSFAALASSEIRFPTGPTNLWV